MEYDPDETTLLSDWAGHLGCLRFDDVFLVDFIVADIHGVWWWEKSNGERRLVGHLLNRKNEI